MCGHAYFRLMFLAQTLKSGTLCAERDGDVADMALCT